MSKQTHGGKREGAGRRPEGIEKKLTTSITLTPTAKRWLDDQEGSNGSIVESLIRSTQGFKRWSRDNEQ